MNSFKSHTECFLYTHSIYFVQLYQKKHSMSTVYPAKTIAHNFFVTIYFIIQKYVNIPIPIHTTRQGIIVCNVSFIFSVTPYMYL